VIRRYARAIAEEFHPDQIILFGEKDDLRSGSKSREG
jgi:hypothetical protein